MKVVTEKAFPRGGQKPGVFMPSKGKLELFHKRPGRVKLKSKAKKREKEKSQIKLKSKGKGVKVLKQTSAKLLNYKTITEGTLILGCVKEITDFAVKVNLPGRIFGEVPINDISNSYTKVLEKLMAGSEMQPSYQLNEMFQVGQYIVTKVMQVKQTADDNVKVILTTSPKEIHSNWAHRNVETGLVLPAAVSSVEDHGYVMDLGISGVRAFLKMKKARRYEEVWNNGNQLYVGQIVRCLVTKSVSTDTITTVELSANPEDVAGAEADVSKVTMQTLTPGMLFTATITHIVQSGVQVKFGKNEVGYVHEDHLNEPFSLLKDIAVGSSYPARILYIQPIVKTVYLTLLNDVCPAQPLPSPFEVLSVGDVVDNAKVIRVTSQGVLLNLGNGLRGFVSVRHASEDLQRDVEKPLIEQLNSLYPSGSHQKCRILGYDYLVQLYSCTLKASVLKDKLFCPDDCKPGRVVSCYINTVKNSGIDVTLGSKTRNLVAFVPAMHMADVPLRQPEKKFKEGSKHKARVLQVKNSRIWLTLKPSLVSSTLPPLCSYENVKRDQPYEGVVILVTAQGLLVEFFNNVKGWVPVYKLGSQDSDMDPTKRYYVGQVVKCYVTDVDLANQKMTLSLVPFSLASSSQVHIGEAFSVEVVSVGPDCLHVQVCNSSERGVIPAQHLTDHPSLSKLLLATYKEGDILSSAYCFSVHDKLVFSVQNSVAQFFQSKLGSRIAAKGVGALQGGEVIPCSVRMVNENGILLNAPVPGLTKSIWVGRKYMGIKEMNPLSLGLVSHQVLMVKLSSFNLETNIFKASTKLSQCWDFNLESTVSLLESYLTDQKRILSHLANQGDPLAKYSPGGMVKGIVKSVTEIGAVVELSDGIHGVVMPHHYKGLSLKPGKQVEGMVLLLDVVNHCLELTLLAEIMCRVNKNQDGVIRGGVGVGMCLRGETMVAKPHQVVVCLKGAGRRQLASIPVRRHLNDFIPLTPLHKLGGVTKIIIQLVGGGIIIGLPKVVIQENESRRKYFLEKTKANVNQENSKPAAVKVTESETDEAYSSDVEASSELENVAGKAKKFKTEKENKGITNVKDESVLEQQNSESDTETKEISFNFDAVTNEDRINFDMKSNKYKQKGGSLNVSSNSLSDMELMHDIDLGIDLREGNKKTSKKTKRKENSMELVSDPEKCLGDVIDLKEESTVGSTKKKGKKSKLKDSPEENIQANQQNTSTTESEGDSAKKKSKKSKNKDVPEQHSVEIHETSVAESDSALDSTKKKKLKQKISSSGDIIIESDQDSRSNPAGNLVEENIPEAKKKKKKKLKRKSISEEGLESSNCFETSVVSLTDTDMNDSTIEPSKKKMKKSGSTNLRAEQLSGEEVNVQPGELEELAISERTAKEIKRDKMNSVLPKEESQDQVESGRVKGPLQSISKSEEVNKNSKRRKRTSSSETEAGSVTSSEKEKAKKGGSEVEIIDHQEVNNVSKPRTLSASIGFVWDAKPDLLPAVARSKADAETSSDDEEDDANKVKKKKKLTPAERRELARLEEKRLREVEQQLMDSERNPQSADDFDRLVLASPNNSMYWIKYMAFHLQATEIEKARAVADRALKTISFREEQEKLNVWVALLNLENLYGTKESLDKVLQDAIQMNDAFKVYIQMLQIYAESSKIQEADKLIHLLTKKFRDRKDTWLQAGEILMKFKQIDKARALMQKALVALEKKEHVEIIMKFALLENKFGEAERAHTLMEHILTSYPKRVDVWSSYVDMLVKSGSLDIARQVLERAVLQKLPARKMKVLFKKFLQFEEQHGTPEGAEKVRLMALEYVNSARMVTNRTLRPADRFAQRNFIPELELCLQKRSDCISRHDV